MLVAQSVNIRPGVGVLGLFPAMNYRAWYALAELVDNAIDSYLVHKSALRAVEGLDYRLRIVIRVEGDGDGLITVWDNAAGIATADYDRAFVTAVPPTESAGLSQFGIGLKSASCWFARQWRVTTTALGESVRRRIDFDVPRIIEENDDELQVWSEPADARAHGTEVRLWDLYKPPQTQTIGKMRRHLASMYREFLRDGSVRIEFNGQAVKYDEPAVLVAPYFADPSGPDKVWRRDVDFSLHSGERVAGFVAIRQKGSTSLAGLSLFRHGRLIVGSDDETYRPPQIFGGSNSYAYQRVFGELSLDGFDVSHTKDAFIWGEREDALLRALRHVIDAPPIPLLRQAEGYRAKRATADLMKSAQRAATSTAAAVERSLPIIEGQITAPVEEGPLPLPEPTSSVTDNWAGERILNLMVRGNSWIVSIELTVDPAATEWVEITDRPMSKSSRKLGIKLSLSHPFTQRYGGPSPSQMEALVRLAAGLAIAEITAREAGMREAGTIRRNLNELLLDALSRD